MMFASLVLMAGTLLTAEETRFNIWVEVVPGCRMQVAVVNGWVPKITVWNDALTGERCWYLDYIHGRRYADCQTLSDGSLRFHREGESPKQQEVRPIEIKSKECPPCNDEYLLREIGNLKEQVRLLKSKQKTSLGQPAVESKVAPPLPERQNTSRWESDPIISSSLWSHE
jgi:hypothetical protein